VASACAHGETGALQVSGGSLPATRPSFAAGALVDARWTFRDPVFVQLEAGAVAPFARDRFILDGTAVYSVSPVNALGGIAIGVRF
jgi:hypothetical protein